MDLKRRVGYRMSVVLLILGNIATAVALSGGNNTIVKNLDCTNDLEESMVCELEAQNCTEYRLTLRNNDEPKEERCDFQQCDTGCRCSFTKMMLVRRESHTATVWKESKSLGSKIINVTDGIKPRVPTIVSVTETNGNFKIMWKTNHVDSPFRDSLTANVTYHKKGDKDKVSEYVKQRTDHGLKYYEIHGRHLEPSTTYVVSVKSYTDWSGRYSDSSEEKEFRTPASTDAILLAVAIILSVAAIIISGAIYCSYVKLKSLWDTVAKCENPKLFDIHSREQEQILKPVPLVLSTVCVEPLIPDDSKPWLKGSLRDTSGGSLQQSSGISTGSSHPSCANAEPADIIAGVQDALGKAFANISPISPLTTVVEILHACMCFTAGLAKG